MAKRIKLNDDGDDNKDKSAVTKESSTPSSPQTKTVYTLTYYWRGDGYDHDRSDGSELMGTFETIELAESALKAAKIARIDNEFTYERDAYYLDDLPKANEVQKLYNKAEFVITEELLEAIYCHFIDCAENHSDEEEDEEESSGSWSTGRRRKSIIKERVDVPFYDEKLSPHKWTFEDLCEICAIGERWDSCWWFDIACQTVFTANGPKWEPPKIFPWS